MRLMQWVIVEGVVIKGKGEGGEQKGGQRKKSKAIGKVRRVIRRRTVVLDELVPYA